MVFKRSCDGCTKCCEGFLPAVIYNKYMYQGRPCHFKKKNGYWGVQPPPPPPKEMRYGKCYV